MARLKAVPVYLSVDRVKVDERIRELGKDDPWGKTISFSEYVNRLIRQDVYIGTLKTK